MTVPSLKTIEGALERMTKQAPVIATKATWVWPWGHDKRRRGQGEGNHSEVSRPTEGAVGNDTWTDSGGRYHPASVEWTVRAKQADAARLIIQAAALLEKAEGTLDEAAKAAGKGDPPVGVAAKPWPPTASKAEVSKARQMRKWRDDERKKGVGRGTY